MKKILVSVACVFLILTTPKSSGAFPDGNWLLEQATSDDTFDKLGYLTFVIGVSRGYRLALAINGLPPAYCVTEPHNITGKDMADAVRLWLRTNPKDLDFSGEVVVVLALTKHFPCPKQ